MGDFNMRNVEKELMEILINKFGMEESHITLDESFSNIGMDSIAIIEFQYEIMRKFGLDQGDLSVYPDDSICLLQNKIYPFIEEK
jgi:acyl carrier protein